MSEPKFLAGFGLANITPEESVPMASYGDDLRRFSEGKFTEDVIEDAFFGCGGVAEIPDLQNKLVRLAKGGFKHHTTVGVGHMKYILEEAFKTYLGYEVIDIEG